MKELLYLTVLDFGGRMVEEFLGVGCLMSNIGRIVGESQLQKHIETGHYTLLYRHLASHLH